MGDSMAEAHHGRSTWWSQAILLGGLLAALLLPAGALGARFGLWSFSTGFLFLTAGVVIAAVGLITGIAGIITAHRRDHHGARRAVYIGTAISAAILAFAAYQFYSASAVPPIHNISTDVDDPPEFDEVVALRGENANPIIYDAAELAPEQQRAYPWVQTLQSGLSPETALGRAVQVLEDMGLEIVSVDETADRVEATDTTFWFGFKDDVVVRVRPGPGNGSLVDMRSVSRVGMSDLGTNARRIGTFLERFSAE
jgi:uncharacterized protein (DUF1499 family)